MDGTVAEQAARWFLLNREAALSEPQRLAFLDWMQRSPEHVREYLRALHLHRQVGAAMGMARQEAVAPDRAVHGTLAKVVPLFASAPRTPAPRMRRARRGWMLAAAAACIALGLGFGLLHLQPQALLLTAGHGQLRDLRLADGTQLRLNADSVVRVRMGWLSRRVELLQGEATFDIAADRRPFLVQVDGLQIRDIGTVFDVSRRLQGTRIGVMSGEVEVWRSGTDARRLAQLDAGRVVLVDHGSGAVQRLDMPASMLLDWQQRKVSFLDERLDEVAAAFNRHNTVQVVVEDAAAASVRLSGSLDAHRVAALQAFLQRDARFAVRRDGDTVRVSSR
ncbi:FecR domain-containing protein [Xanthomonas sp. NCPPB 2654]|uniref:FecR family protein n=1 Tax=unclassified Xanthomonas TaxID=2643310 RepID=UPI0021DFFD6F|nr:MULTISPECIES: FecR domain-containing protein [unclassified Xanthomonas]MDL5364765.1 FecR domain-containing protein [Xanthomonas sp. NCPPB 2654]UYC22075.1 FecR domain-containing protein [Xanthomonas sp. CFBP 8443]